MRLNIIFRSIIVCLAFIEHSCLLAQDKKLSRILFHNKVPVVVETEYLINDFSSNSDNTTTGVLKVISDSLKIYIPRDSIFLSNSFILNNPWKKQTTSLEYRIFDQSKLTDKWRPVLDTFSSIGARKKIVLLDAHLSPGTQIQFQLREVTGQLLENLIIQRIEIKPKLLYYRAVNIGDIDLVKSKIGIKSISVKNLIPFSEGNNSLELSPGKVLLLLFDKQGVNIDSSLQYRTSSNGEKPEWKTTGHVLILDSLKANSLTYLEVKYPFSGKSFQLSVITLPHFYERLWFRILILTILIVSISLILFLRYRSIQKKEKIYQSLAINKIKSIQSQLNPHFIFNTLSSIQYFINKNESKKAINQLIEFSELLRAILFYGNELLIPLSDEIDILDRYLKIEQARGEFSYEINIQPEELLNKVEIPPMLIQPSVENAIKHGMAGLKEKGSIQLNFIEDGSDLVIEVVNSRNVNNESKVSKSGYGIPLTQERIIILNSIFKENQISWHIQFGVQYTTVKIHFSKWLQ